MPKQVNCAGESTENFTFDIQDLRCADFMGARLKGADDG